MKKVILIAISAFSINAFAQPVIQDGSNIPTQGFSAPVSMATPSSGVGSPGANQTWDFSSLAFTSLGTMNVITPSSSPIGSSFPTANYAYSFASTYSFFYTSANKMEVQAYSITTPGSGNDFTPNPRTILKFPFNYLDTEVDTWQKVAGPTNNVTLTYDGYGSLITPANTYTNVVRVKEDYGSGIDYQWYYLNPLISLMTYDHNTNALYFTDATLTGISEQNNSNLSVNIFPNPSNGTFSIESTTENSTIEIANTLGEIIYSSQINSDKAEIDLSNQPTGIYFATIQNGEEIIYKKIIIAK
ncbi:hypothetical protein BH09BAC5_BH09BAC5_12890 [soil metagenome]